MTAPVQASIKFPLHRFEEFGSLTPSELDAVQNMGGSPRAFRRGCVIRPEGVEPKSFFLLVDGWVTASHSVPDGGRQILKVHLPGDALGTPSMAVSQTAEELTALTDVIIIEVPFARFGRLFETHPRVAARFMLSIQLERVALMDRLASMGRTTAEARIASLLLDLMERLEPLGKVRASSFELVLTQEQLADVLGLTSVHVNRMFRSLSERGLIRRTGSTLTCLDESGLAKIACRTKRRPAVDLSWLPAAAGTLVAD